MIEIDRPTFKSDPIWRKLFESLRDQHKVADHTENTLLENKHTKDFCVESRQFIVIDRAPQIYLHYDTANWFKEPMGVQVRIESIGIYDDFMEYEKARMFQLHRAQSKDIPNIN